MSSKGLLANKRGGGYNTKKGKTNNRQATHIKETGLNTKNQKKKKEYTGLGDFL